MKVLHVIPSLSPSQGGPSVALPLMARSLVRVGVGVDVATTDDDGPGARLDVPLGQGVEQDGYRVFHFQKQTEFYKISLPFRFWIRHRLSDYDLVHIHALFSYTSNYAAQVAWRHGIPYVIRPLGVLNRWGFDNRRRWLKALSFRFIEAPILKRAAAMHYTAGDEMREAQAAGATAPGTVIPLGLELEPFLNLPPAEKFYAIHPQTRGRPIVLFLSRLDAKKGLDLLLPAFAQIRAKHPRAVLVIAGRGEDSFQLSLRAEVQRFGLADDVVFPGFITGSDKLAALAAATVYVLPSYSENFGIALVEALAAGLPCVTTEGVAVSADLRELNAGLVVAPQVGPLAGALDRMLGDSTLRRNFGEGGRSLAQKRFSSEVMGMALVEFYRRTLSAARP